jgi:hypothetical protein
MLARVSEAHATSTVEVLDNDADEQEEEQEEKEPSEGPLPPRLSQADRQQTRPGLGSLQRQPSRKLDVGMNLQGVDHVYIEDSIKSTDKSGSFSHRMSVTLDAAVPSRMKGTKVVEIAGRMITVGRGVEQGFCGILMPWNRAVVAWELVSIFLLAYTATVLPAKLAFVKADEASVWEFSDPLSPFEFAIDIFFLLDIMRNFRMCAARVERAPPVASHIPPCIRSLAGPT